MSAAGRDDGAVAPAVGRLPSAAGAALRRRLDALQRIELGIVTAQRRLSERGVLRAVGRTANCLGNGWLYLPLAVALWIDGSRQARGVLLGTALAVAAAHSVYPWIKRRTARPRPFERLQSLHAGVPALDRYSFPSGHCMTATAVAIPLAHGYPGLLWTAVAACAVIAWGRLACAHHYPSDVVAGSALGAVMACASTELLSIVAVLP